MSGLRETCLFCGQEIPANSITVKVRLAEEEMRDTIDAALREVTGFGLDEVAAAMPRWIPVSESLPGDGEIVLTCDRKGNMHTRAHYHFYGPPFGIDGHHARYYMVTHWMQLPAPPVAGKETV